MSFFPHHGLQTRGAGVELKKSNKAEHHLTPNLSIFFKE
jgi:hypothetical protein